MLTPQESRPTAPVTTAARSTKCIETAQSAFRSIRAAGARPLRSSGLVLNDHELRQQALLQVSKFGPQIARAVHVDVRRGEVTLSGVVDSDYERSLIDQAVTRLAGVQQLSNEIELRRAESERNVAKLGVSALGKSLWKAVAIAGLLVAVAASLLLMFQVASAAAGDGRPGMVTLAGDGARQPSSFCAARGDACDCCTSPEMRR
jgi:hypothetical protein